MTGKRVKRREDHSYDDYGVLKTPKPKKQRQVSSLTITRPMSLNEEQVAAVVIMCLTGELCDMSQAQAHVLMRAFHTKPACISLADHLDAMMDRNNGILELEMQKVTVAQHEEGRRMRANKFRRAIKKSREMIYHVTHKHNNTTGETAVRDLREVDWDDYVSMGVKPVTASIIMMQTQPCEHVALIKPVLKWMRFMPPFMDNREKQKPIEIPWSAPTTSWEYKRIEMLARRAQRLFYPGLTSLEVERVILLGTLGLMGEEDE